MLDDQLPKPLQEDSSINHTPEQLPTSTWMSSLLRMPKIETVQKDRIDTDDKNIAATVVNIEKVNPYTFGPNSTELSQAPSHESSQPVAKNSITQSLESYRDLPTPAVIGFHLAWGALGATSIFFAHQQLNVAINNFQKGVIVLGGIPTIPLLIISCGLTVMWATSGVVLAERAYARITKPFN